jgi:hypothetical protein
MVVFVGGVGGIRGGGGSGGTDLAGELGPLSGQASLALLLVGGAGTYTYRAR